MTFAHSHEIYSPSPEVEDRLFRNGTPLHIVNSGPMGGGKSAVNSAILGWVAPYDLQTHGTQRTFSVSWASRLPRPGEVDGVDYTFGVSPERFQKAVEQGELLEHVAHAGGWYGTPMPIPGNPMLYEIEPTGVEKAITNRHPNAYGFRKSLVAIYLVQKSMEQLLSQILARPDGMDEGKKIARAARYPGELLYILNHALPYQCIENRPGEQEQTILTALKVVASDPEATILSVRQIIDKATEACDYLTDNGIEPTMHIE